MLMIEFELMFVFFFKQKTAYELRISDWSSDVCSSDLRATLPLGKLGRRARTSTTPLPCRGVPDLDAAEEARRSDFDANEAAAGVATEWSHHLVVRPYGRALGGSAE